MCADKRVGVGDRLAALDAALLHRGSDLLDTGVHRLQAVESLLEQRAQTPVGLNGVAEESVASSLGLVEDVQEGGAGRLGLIRDIGVPGNGAGSGGEELFS